MVVDRRVGLGGCGKATVKLLNSIKLVSVKQTRGVDSAVRIEN